MSSIGAIFDTNGVRADMLEALSDSLGAIPHDDLGRWRSGKLALAAATTHTTAESHDQAQPCAGADGKLAAVFDGYLLNHAEIASELEARGARLRNHSDVEIVLAGYEAWGEAVAEKLRGEYSLIIADLRANRLFVTRDHMGFVPLYYKEEQGRLIIASDLRTIYALSSTPLEPNKRFLAQMLANRYYLREDTVWSGVKKFIRAHTYSFDGERMRASRYWVPDTKISIRYSSEGEYVEHYKEVLFDCVRRASRADRLVGIAVSGGLDSSSIFCIADILEKRGELQAPGFTGYSLAAEEGSNAYELPYARAVAEHVGRPLTEVPLFDPDIDWYIEDARWHRDISMGSNGAMMLGMDRRAVADGSRVMINGSGGDEWLQGNTQYYREYIAEGEYGAFGKALARDAESVGWLKALKQAGRQTVAELTPGAIRSRIQERLRQQRRSGAFAWLSEEMRDILAQAEEDYVALLPENGVHLAKHNLVMSPFHDKVYGLMRRQRAMAGLQSRHPMLSRAFIDFSLSTPAEIKRKGTLTKAIHRESMKNILPQKVLERRTKANFTNIKIDQQFAEYARAHAPDRLAGLCDLQGMKRILNVDYATPEGDLWAWEIWGLYATAAFLYQGNCVNEIYPATGVQQDRK